MTNTTGEHHKVTKIIPYKCNSIYKSRTPNQSLPTYLYRNSVYSSGYIMYTVAVQKTPLIPGARTPSSVPRGNHLSSRLSICKHTSPVGCPYQQQSGSIPGGNLSFASLVSRPPISGSYCRKRIIEFDQVLGWRWRLSGRFATLFAIMCSSATFR